MPLGLWRTVFRTEQKFIMKRLRDEMSHTSYVRYLWWRASRTRSVLTVTLRSGLKVSLRPPPSTDLSTAYELYVDEIYRPAREAGLGDVRLVVDLGANVGFSVLYFARTFGRARILAFEPHPRNSSSLQRNVGLNGLESRVEIFQEAACCSPGLLRLTDSENTSRVSQSEGSIVVRGTDIFERLKSEQVDVLKMDIEGGEYALLSDRRFFDLAPRFLIMEWHGTHEGRLGSEWCEATLTLKGYRVTQGTSIECDGQFVGMLWAQRILGEP